MTQQPEEPEFWTILKTPIPTPEPIWMPHIKNIIDKIAMDLAKNIDDGFGLSKWL